MSFNWDPFITGGILAVIGLAIWARVGRQTIGELLRDLLDSIRGAGEESVENVERVVEI